MKALIISVGLILALVGAYQLTREDGVGSTSFPTSLDTLTNPTATDRTNVVSHADQHSNANDAIEALQAKVGVSSSSVITSHSYKLSEVLGAYKAVSTGGSQVIEGTKRYIGSLIASSTVLSAISPKFTTDIRDTNGNVLFGLTASSSAVNYFQLSNAGTNGTPRLTPAGSGTNIPFILQGKGSGQVEIGDARLKFPDTDGASNNVLKTDGAGNLGWSSGAGITTASTSIASGTTTLSFSATTGQKVMVFVEADYTGNSSDNTFTLKINGVTRDQRVVQLGAGTNNVGFSLQALVTATTTGTMNVRVDRSAATAAITNFSAMALII